VRDGTLTTYGYTTYAGIASCTYELEPFPYNHKDIMLDSNLARDDLAIFFLGDFYQTADIVAGDSSLTVVATAVSGFKDYLQSEVLWTGEGGEVGWTNTPADRGAAGNKLLTQVEASPAAGDSVPQALQVLVSINATGCSNHEIRVYEMGLLIYVLQPLPETVFGAELYGRSFQDTWGGRKTATNLVESPAEVIESILRLELGVVAAGIDTTAFDAVDTARSGYKVAGQLHEFKDSIEVIDEIAREHCVLYNITGLGQHGLIPLDYSATAVDTLTLRDFIEPYEKLQISQTPREAAVNDVRLFYARDQFDDEYKQIAYCNKDGYSGSIGSSYQTKCSTSYAALGNRVQKFEAECNWVNDEATAEAIVKWLIDWNGLQRYILDGQMFMDKYKLELGDIVALYLPELLPPSVTSASRFMVTQKDLYRSSGQVSVQLLQVFSA
jgi:hypothetical protein